VLDKNFYLLTLLERDSAERIAITQNPRLSAIATARPNNIARALPACKSDTVCVLKGFLWTDEEIYAVSLSLDRAAKSDPTLRRIVEQELRPSRAYILFEGEPDGELLGRAWGICARGMNEAISVYGEGAAPRYPAIDSISVDTKSAEFQQRILALAKQYAEQDSQFGPFFEPSFGVALELLELNHRDEAGRLEPMETGANQAALKAVAEVNWKQFPFAAIVVPGAGASDYTTPLSDNARNRCALAADAYHAGKAPVLIVSGGFVHPSQARFSETLEMKKALIADFGVPEQAIFVDPHARDTTTNLCNAAREIFRDHIATGKPVLVVSDAAQIDHIASQVFADRCLKELGYMPYRLVRRENETAVVVEPMIESLQQDPIDPLDP